MKYKYAQKYQNLHLFRNPTVTHLVYEPQPHPTRILCRHYTFYIWRRIMMRHWTIKYMASPIYMFGMYHAFRCLAKSDLIFKILLPLCVFINMVPQLLLEFRYCIIPPPYQVSIETKLLEISMKFLSKHVTSGSDEPTPARSTTSIKIKGYRW